MKKIGTIFYFFISIILMASCSDTAVKIPDDVISKDSMAFIMMDIHIAESGVKTLSNDSVDINNKTFYQFIYKKHHITEEQFQKSLRFYTYYPEVLQEIYVRMAEEMSKKEPTINNLP